jgi:diguanylate cyclase (GGDEF)-like protein
LFKYIYGIYNKEDIDIVQNGKIIISKKFMNIGNAYFPPCDPFKHLGQCSVRKNNKIYVVQFSPAFDLIIESDFKINNINKKEIAKNILGVLRSIPGLIIYYNGKKISGKFNKDSFYIFEEFKPLKIFFGTGVKYDMINKLSNVINKEIFSTIKPFITSFLIAYAILLIMLYIGLFIIFKYKIEFIEKVLDEYNKKAHFDKLTNLYNRHGFETIFDTKKCNYFLIIDLDNFKYINDTFGHKTGDKVLKYFSALLKHYFDDSIIARWGGDEFLICTNKSKKEIKHIIDTISSHLINYQKSFDHQLHKKLSVSAGGCDNNNNDFQRKFNNADLALYKVKKTGKGTILFFEELEYVKIEKNDVKK